MEPKVSIVIPVYNGEDYISEAINSALAQTYDNCEIIVVNDGSIDRTEAIVKSYGDKIRYFSKKNGGVSSALNVGIDHMEGEYFQYLPHDDLLHPDKIEKNIKAIQQSGNEMSIVWSGWNYNYMDERGMVKFQIPYEYADKNKLTNSVFPLLFSLLNTVTVLINKRYFDKVGKFNTDLYTSQDYDMWFRTFIDQRTIYLDEDLVDYRIHEQQGTQADHEFVRNCITMSENMVSKLSDQQIIDMFGNKYRFIYYMMNFYRQCGWEKCYKHFCSLFKECNEPPSGALERERLQQYLLPLDHKKDNIVLYCAGKNAEKLLHEFQMRNIYVRALSDRDTRKIGTEVSGTKCILLKDIDKKKDFVIVTKDEPEDVLSDLQKMGFKNITSFKNIGSKVYETLPIKQNVLKQLKMR